MISDLYNAPTLSLLLYSDLIKVETFEEKEDNYNYTSIAQSVTLGSYSVLLYQCIFYEKQPDKLFVRPVTELCMTNPN